MSKRMRLACKILVDETGHKAIQDTESGTTFTMIASTPEPDRSGEKIRSDAWHWSDPLPKLHWGHQHKNPEMVIGKLTGVRVENGNLIVDGELADKVPGHKMAALVAGLMKNGDVDQGSVGFIPKAWFDRNGRKVMGAQNYRGPQAGNDYTDVELFEFSLTTVPDQPGSIMTRLQEVEEQFVAMKSLVDALQEPVETPKEAKPVDPKTAPAKESNWLDRLLKGEPATKAVSDTSLSDQARAALTSAAAALEAAEDAIEVAEMAIAAVLGTAAPADESEAA